MIRTILLFIGMMIMMQTTAEATRPCAVCGTFYPADKQELQAMIHNYLKEAKSVEKKNEKALIVPHAGYVYSAPVAAVAYKTLHKKYKNIFLLGSSHHVNFDGVSLYNKGDYLTPLGKVHVNQTIVQKLIDENEFITYKPEAHAKEHTLEVQLPFLQSIYKEDELTIVPIIMATSNTETINKMANVLAPYFEDDANLFIISTDLSHYPAYEDAKRVDMETLKAIESNSVERFISTIIKHEKEGIANLGTSACGWAPLITLLSLTQNKNYTYELLEYKNSGDTPYGEKERVVGYGAMRVYKNDTTNDDEEFTLSDEEKAILKEIAKLALYEAVEKNQRISIDASKIPPKLKRHLGAFVTLQKHGKLRGCIGRFEPDQPLYEVIIDMAISASRYDNRFNPVTPDELKDIDIEISVLTPRKRVNSVDDVVVGKHGIYIEYNGRSGTYLPQVATDMGWNAEEFVRSCCIEKAGIAPEHCKDATLWVYEAIVF